MFTNGADYQLARRLKAFEDNELYVLRRESRIALMREEIRKNSNKVYERSAAVYNRRSRNVRFAVRQEVYRKNFTLSNFGQNYNAIMYSPGSRDEIPSPLEAIHPKKPKQTQSDVRLGKRKTSQPAVR